MPEGPLGGRRPFVTCTPAVKVTGRRPQARNFSGLDRAEFEAEVHEKIERSGIDNRPDVTVSSDLNTLFVAFPEQEVHPNVPEEVRQTVVEFGDDMAPVLSGVEVTVVCL